MSNESRIRDLYLELKKIIPELDARIIIKYVLDLDDAIFFRDIDRKLSIKQIDAIKKLVARRAKGEPVAYLTGHKEFYGLDFFVNYDVLIPRPESEWIVEQALDKLTVNRKPLTVLDIGTGSGNIIISIIKSLSTNHYALTPIFFAADISKSALKVARKNARIHGTNNIKFIQSDLFKNIDSNVKFDLMVANLPYVPKKVNSEKWIMDSIDFEPKNAIFAADNGAAIIKKFLREAKDRLTPNGAILIELDPRNAIDLKNYAKKLYPNSTIELKKDLVGLNRYLTLSSRA